MPGPAVAATVDGLSWACASQAKERAVTRRLPRVDWTALGSSVGSAVLFALLVSAPFLLGAPSGMWLLGPAAGLVVGVYLYLRRERFSEPGPDADETRFPR
jgi:hypothetical protein